MRTKTSHARLGTLIAGILALLVWGASPAAARLEVSVFARVPAPGYPANAIAGADGTVYVGTFKSFSSPADTGPSKVFAFSPQGRLVRSYTVQGQTRGTADAVQVATVDRQGMLYLLDQDPARVVKLDPRTGRQTTWATFKSLPACGVPTITQCSDGMGGNPPEPDFAAWGPDGSLYVTDYNQAVIWRIPPGGGPAAVWLTDPRFNGTIVGPAGIQLMADHRTLMVDTGGGGGNISTGKLYRLPIEPGQRPGTLQQIWESASLEAPDGFAIARSGNIYVALVGPSGNAVDEISPQGQLIGRVPATAADNNALGTPFDAPGSVTFYGDKLLVANEASIDNDSTRWAILEISAGEPGLRPSLPPLAPAPRVRYRLRVSPRHVHAGRRVRLSFRAWKIVRGHWTPLAGARISFDGRRLRCARNGRVIIRVVLHGRHRGFRAWLLVGGRRVARVTVRTR